MITPDMLEGMSRDRMLRLYLAIKEQKRRAAEKSLVEFIRQGWKVVEPGRAFVPGWHIEAVADHLEAVARGEIKNLLINIPPRHMKSLTVGVFFPAWVWTHAPEKRWLFSAYAESLSKRDSVKCRRLIQSPWFQSQWADRFALTDDQNEKMRFENDRLGYRIATSVGGAGTGEGGDFIVVDDPHKASEVHSRTKRESVLEWWDQEMQNRVNDPKNSARIIVMQRLHEKDLSGHVLRQGGWEHLCLPVEYETTPQVFITSTGFSDPRDEAGDLLWPERFSADTVAEMKKVLGSFGVAGQLQQRPAPAEGGIIKEKWFRFFMVPPETFDEKIQSWDLAFKKTEDSDFVAGGIFGRKGADTYFLDLYHARASFTESIRAVIALTQRHPDASIKLVEAKANGPAVVDMLKSKLTGLIEVEPEGSKEARVHASSPIIEGGNLWLPHPSICPWSQGVIDEFKVFPNGDNDDRVDIVTQALLHFEKGTINRLDKLLSL